KIFSCLTIYHDFSGQVNHRNPRDVNYTRLGSLFSIFPGYFDYLNLLVIFCRLIHRLFLPGTFRLPWSTGSPSGIYISSFHDSSQRIEPILMRSYQYLLLSFLLKGTEPIESNPPNLLFLSSTR